MLKPIEVRVPDPGITDLPRRRFYTAEYKLKIIQEAEAAKEIRGGVAMLLRREGLYSSHLKDWRNNQRQGTLAALSKKRGRKSTANPLEDENERLRRENEKLKAKLAQAELIIDVQKKVASLLGIPLKTPEDDDVGS